MLYDINIEAWYKIEIFWQRDVSIIYILFILIYSYFYILHHCANFGGKLIACYVQK